MAKAASKIGKKIRCPHCKKSWHRRVNDPKECPFCKQYL